MIRRFISWARAAARPESPARLTAPTDDLDRAIAASEARYAQLRRGLTALLFVEAKTKAEVGPSSSLFTNVRRRVSTLTAEMTHARAELDSLRRSRLEAHAERAYLEAM